MKAHSEIGNNKKTAMNEIFTPPHLQTKEQKKQYNKKRYELHAQVRKAGFFLNSKDRTISIPYNAEKPDNKYLNELIDCFGYAVQYEIV